MKNQKSIIEIIRQPAVAAKQREVTDNIIEITGVIDSLLLHKGEYRTFDCTDAVMVNLTALNVVCYEAAFIRSQFIKANMTGVQLSEAYFKDVTFTNCRINLSNFRKATFERCAFVECDLREADFGGTQLMNVLFDSCELSSIDFSNATCKRVEFADTNLSTIKGVSGLSGSTITDLNLIELAPLLAQAAGFTVEQPIN